MHSRHGERLAHGFHVGDLVTYEPGVRFGHVIPETGRENPTVVRALFADSEAEAAERYAHQGRTGTTCGLAATRLIRRFDDMTSEEGSNTMTAEAATEQGTWEPTTEPIPEGTRFRFYHEFNPIVEDRFAYEGTMLSWAERTWRYDVAGTWGEGLVGSERVIDCDEHQLPQYRVWVPTPSTPANPENIAYDGTVGTFEPHNGQAPEPGTPVRAYATGNPNRQVEGLFLSIDGDTATVERKRRRLRRGDGTMLGWEPYGSGGRTTVQVEGALVFKAGAAGTGTLVRTTPITNAEGQRAITPGMILSARSMGGRTRRIYRGEVITSDEDGTVLIMATEQSTLVDEFALDDSAYSWEPYGPQEMTLHCVWDDGRAGRARAGWLWERADGSVKRVDPAYDPKRKTRYTGMAIGDLVVGLCNDAEYSRDTVGSWVKGRIVKWDMRAERPIVKVTDPMESGKKVDAEVALVNEDVYPAMADPASASPEEYKRTLRLYLIGRHKRGDFCRGGLNTMLAAHGIPLYETRRRATLQVTVDYDPNSTDLYTVQRGLQRGLPGVQGLSFTERSGEDIELAVESDLTVG